jgi:hypothetical protein
MYTYTYVHRQRLGMKVENEQSSLWLLLATYSVLNFIKITYRKLKRKREQVLKYVGSG